MRTLLLASALSCTALFGVTQGASAAASPQSVCTGQYASGNAGPQFGPFVASYAVFLHGIALGSSSSSNDCSNYPPPYILAR